jgi:DNA repair photolyase
MSKQEHLKEITVKSALHYHESEMPCHWDVNVYRGCGHGCKYCFAQYSHNYLDSADFFDDIFVKSNIAEVLDKELSKKSWKKPRINLAGVTDSYQPAEAQYQKMPEILKILTRHRNPVIITTKSSLILRDIDLIKELASVTSVCIGASITMMDENLRKLIEPGASPALERFRVLKECKDAGCDVNILLTPVLPYITDSLENLEEIYEIGASIGVNGISPWPLNLKGNTRQRFFSFLKEYFPGLLPKYFQLYKSWHVDSTYAQELREKVKYLGHKYNTPGISLPQEEQKPETIQLSLF